MKKVTIEVTENWWKTTLEINGKTLVEQHESTSTGSKRISGGFEDALDNDEITEDLFDSITGFSQYDIMNALRESF